MVSEINIRNIFCLFLAKNVVPVEDIIEMHNVDDTLTEASRYIAI